MSIPFNKPSISGNEFKYIQQAVEKSHISGDGYFTKLCHNWIEQELGITKALLTTSCTAALEMAALLCDLEPGDEVIMPSFTFVSTANAFVLRGATIKFVDIRKDTLNIDETLIERVITAKSKVIVPVHYAGVSCEMDTIMELSRKYNLTVVEDSAQAVKSTYKGKSLGGIAHLGAFSFHETKNLISGEGGALLINNDEFIERAEIIREKGTNRSKFFRGEVDKYTWVDIGSSYLPSELIAAFLYAQFEQADKIIDKRLKIYKYYFEALKDLADEGKIILPSCPPECGHNAHMFYILDNTSNAKRDKLIQFLKTKKIHSVFHYVPLHQSPMNKKMKSKIEQLPVTESSSARLIRLPFYNEITEKQQTEVVSAITEYFGQC